MIQNTMNKRLSSSDAIVSGIFAGFFAGISMLIVLVVGGMIKGENFFTILTLISLPGIVGTPLLSILLHLGVSLIYGALFGILIRFLPGKWLTRRVLVLAGCGYGLILYLLAILVILPGSRSGLGVSSFKRIFPFPFGLWVSQQVYFSK